MRATYGIYTQQFVANSCVAIGWLDQDDLTEIRTRDQISSLYQVAYPKDTSQIVIGQQVGQIARFLLDIAAGDVVITPDANTERIRYGIVGPNPSYFFSPGDKALPFPHRRRVQWASEPLLRSTLSVPLQNTLKSSLTVFNISQIDEILNAIGLGDKVEPSTSKPYKPYDAVLNQVLTLDDKEFEILVGHLLTAVGFEGSEVVGKTGDGGVDATGELDVAGLAKVKVFVQAKRYALGNKVNATVVKQLRMAIPFGGQGAFITTADFQSKAFDIAFEAGFPRIGLVNGSQLVDLLVEHWDKIPQDFQERLGLRRGLVLSSLGS